ncbi:MAG TPA: hypothetical protein ENK89_00415 [Desulfobulbaceae bacterium]|nr:hypothetical protein [Desulfobulbaceae bacterium]
MEQLFAEISRQVSSFESIKYLLIFLAVFVEGPLATLVAAAMAAGGVLRPLPVFFSAALGNLSADLCWYALGYAGRYSRVLQHLPWLRSQESIIHRVEKKMQRHGIRILIFAKFWFGVAAIPALIAAGLLHLPWYRILPAAIVCEVVWSGALVLTGYYLTAYLGGIENILARSTFIGLTGAALVVLFYLLKKIVPRLTNRFSGST